MKYELIIETKACTLFSNHPHNRDGLTAAFDKVEKHKDADNFIGAEIISERDGSIYKFNK